MTNYLDNPLIQFMIGGTILSGGAYVANNFNAFLAALVGSFPLELIMLFLIQKSETRRHYAKSLVFINLALVVSGTLYYFFEPHDFLSKNYKILLALFVWMSISIVFYFIEKKIIKKNKN